MVTYMQAGKLDRRIQFRRATLSDDGFGSVEVWADYGDAVWAEKTDVSDGERFRNGITDAGLSSRFVIRSSEFSRGLSPNDRLTCDGREYAVIGIKEVGRRDALEITTSVAA